MTNGHPKASTTPEVFIIPINELYNRLQDFCRRQIDREIVG